MNRFWDIVEQWDPFGQGLFFLLMTGGVLGTILGLVFYTTVMLQGWPH